MFRTLSGLSVRCSHERILLKETRKFSNSSNDIVVPVSQVKSFIEQCCAAVGIKHYHAHKLADCMVEADLRGHYSHGLNRIGRYVYDIKAGICSSTADPVIVREMGATAHVDGKNCLGPVVGDYAMAVACQKAREFGVGWVVAKGSSYFGIAGWYSSQAARDGLIGLTFSNTSPHVVPTRAKKAALGTNALSVSASAKGGDGFDLDMATSAVTYGQVELAELEHKLIPRGWGADSKGQETTDPAQVIEGGGLLPLGGDESSGGYKGYGLAMMVELFCGVLGGADFGPNVRQMSDRTKPVNLSQCFIAVNPDAFEAGFRNRFQNFLTTFRNLQPAEGQSEVLVAGDLSRKHKTVCEKAGGIPYHVTILSKVNDIAKDLGAPQLEIKAR